MSRLTPRTLAAAIASTLVLSLAAASSAQAEGTLRIAQQFGVVYMLLNVAQDSS